MIRPHVVAKAFLAASYLEEERQKALERRIASWRKSFKEGAPKGNWGPRARQEAIRRAGGVTTDYVSMAVAVLNHGIPELIEAAKACKIPLDAARNIAKLDRRSQLANVELALHGGRVTGISTVAPFARKILSGLERTALVCSEEGVTEVSAIAAKFLGEMNWSDPGQVAQFDRAMALVDAMVAVRKARRTTT